ncbi:MAG: STAS domain-containing protein [Kangiellaceae bacterium]|jgi:anti-anti-sigma factor|nr:STAS domain-containing protein [Kangiellaceae bacterium]
MATKTTVSCGQYLDIQHAAELKARLLKAVDKQPSQCVLTANKVERVDSAGLQLIYAFMKELDQMGTAVSWKQPTESLQTGAKLLGMTELLNL